MNRPDTVYIIRWKEKGRANRAWYIFGLDARGRFFGEVTQLDVPRSCANIVGTLTSTETAAAAEWIDAIRTNPGSQRDLDNVDGILAEGPRFAAAIIYKCSSAEALHDANHPFRQLTELIMTHVISRKLLGGLNQDSKAV